MKKGVLVTLAVLLCLLCACTPAAPQETTVPTESTAPAETQVQWHPFTGKKADYVFLHSRERDRKWEEDILYMADSYLSDYALLTHFPSRIEWPEDVEYSDCFYDPVFREGFLAEVNEMIREIPDLTDAELLWRIQKLVATFGDAHASIYLPDTDYFPICFKPFFTEEDFSVHAVILPDSYETQLLWELDQINGFTIGEIVELLRPYVSYENETYLINRIFDMDGAYVMREDILKIAGILPEDSDTLDFRFLAPYGGVATISLEALSEPQLRKVKYVGHPPEYAYSLMYSDRDGRNYWFQHMPENDMLYIRINEFAEHYDYSFLTMGNELLKTNREAGGVGKLVVDLRDNPGGYQFQGYYEFVTVLKRMEPDSVYVLIDGNSFSSAIVMASAIRRCIPETVFVGTPAGQPANFFAGMWDGDYVMPNCGVTLRLPTAWYYNLPEDENDALLPDLPVYPKLVDYANCVDTVLEAVKWK